ncbi:hypothetical protein H257_11948 [Aphanomyces astaci]|uniref:Uncharacterized protein n=1 Tax=Aphanomyces astaci TaxID=112090 RepID=W4G0A4_APHAT|nr:hypothetical protein H257_11948 [Aphanomyces astaci]ETV73127.1 hypothetical protein H257_11948 [Aphanomyces astaci]|eukprot:XP_009837332.1 hypothetical protein H257_11948 [Aphanomyces astaci]
MGVLYGASRFMSKAHALFRGREPSCPSWRQAALVHIESKCHALHVVCDGVGLEHIGRTSMDWRVDAVVTRRVIGSRVVVTQGKTDMLDGDVQYLEQVIVVERCRHDGLSAVVGE